jgi:hypothetical protein
MVICMGGVLSCDALRCAWLLSDVDAHHVERELRVGDLELEVDDQQVAAVDGGRGGAVHAVAVDRAHELGPGVVVAQLQDADLALGVVEFGDGGEGVAAQQEAVAGDALGAAEVDRDDLVGAQVDAVEGVVKWG